MDRKLPPLQFALIVLGLLLVGSGAFAFWMRQPEHDSQTVPPSLFTGLYLGNITLSLPIRPVGTPVSLPGGSSSKPRRGSLYRVVTRSRPQNRVFYHVAEDRPFFFEPEFDSDVHQMIEDALTQASIPRSENTLDIPVPQDTVDATNTEKGEEKEQDRVNSVLAFNISATDHGDEVGIKVTCQLSRKVWVDPKSPLFTTAYQTFGDDVEKLVPKKDADHFVLQEVRRLMEAEIINRYEAANLPTTATATKRQ